MIRQQREMKFRAYISHFNKGMVFLNGLMGVIGGLAIDYELSVTIVELGVIK